MKYEIGDFNIEVGNKSVPCKLWTSLDERKWLTLKSEQATLADFANTLIFPNMKYQPLTYAEFVYVCLKMRAISSSSVFSSSYKCSNSACERRIDFDMNINDVIQFVPPKIESETIIESKDVRLTIQRIPTKELMLKVLAQEDEQTQRYFEFYASIKSFTYKGKTNDQFTFNEIQEFVDSLRIDIFQDLFSQFYDLMGTIELTIIRKCLICQTDTKVVFQKVSDFL